MSKAANNPASIKVSTKQRVLAASLKLFNQQGERRTSTNHIAEAAGMSPGNLYYHYKNKGEIIYALFEQYRQYMAESLSVPQDRPFTWADKMGYFEVIFQSMWDYRFLHHDLAAVLGQDARLHVAYHEFVQHTLEQAKLIYQGLLDSGLLEADADTVESLIVNTWVVATSWASFLDASFLGAGVSVSAEGVGEGIAAESTATQKALVARGIYQIIALEAPYLRGEALAHLPEYKQKFSQIDSLLGMLVNKNA